MWRLSGGLVATVFLISHDNLHALFSLCMCPMLFVFPLNSKLVAVTLMTNMIGCNSNHANCCCCDDYFSCLEQEPFMRAPSADMHLPK